MKQRRPLRIAYVTASLEIGGSERQMLALAERLPRDRFSVDFILLTHRGAQATRAEAAGARVFVAGGLPRGEAALPLVALSVTRAVARYIAWARARRYHIVDAWLYHAYAVAAVTRPVTRVPILIAGRRSLSNVKEPFGRVERALDALSRRWSDVIVANSTEVRDDAIAREHVDPRKIRVIRNGVDLPPVMPDERRRELRGAWHVGDRDLVVGCVANFLPGKGHDVLIRAIAHVRGRLDGAAFVLVGDGPLRGASERLADSLAVRDVIRFHGAEPNAAEILGAFDVVVQASLGEGLPNAVLEAAAAGRAIVATAAGGTPEIVEDGRTGLLVPVGDERALGEALIRALADPPLRRRLGAAAQARAQDRFAMGRFVAEFAELYEELARKRGLIPD